MAILIYVRRMQPMVLAQKNLDVNILLQVPIVMNVKLDILEKNVMYVQVHTSELTVLVKLVVAISMEAQVINVPQMVHVHVKGDT